MLNRLVALFSAFSVVTLQSTTGYTQENLAQNSPGSKQIKISYCVADKSKPPPMGTRNVLSAVGRLSHSGYLKKGVKFEAEFTDNPACLQKSGNGCFGESGAVFCNLDSLTDLLERTAWIAASGSINAMRGITKNEGGLAFEDKIGWENASVFSEIRGNAKNRDDFAAQLIGVVEERDIDAFDVVEAGEIVQALLQYDADLQSNMNDFHPGIIMAYPVYEAASNYIVSFIFGHELAHAYEGCIFSQPSIIETSNRFTQILDTQRSGKFFGKNNLSLDEALAERCALRGVQHMDTEMVAYKNSKPDASVEKIMLTFGRRMAIDGAGIILTTNLGSNWSQATNWQSPGEDGLPTTSYNVKIEPGYLYYPLRIAMLSELLQQLEHSDQKFIKICDNTAKLFVMGLNVAIAHREDGKYYEGKFDHSGLAAIFGSLVGPGVIDGWENGNWDSANSFACESKSNK